MSSGFNSQHRLSWNGFTLEIRLKIAIPPDFNEQDCHPKKTPWRLIPEEQESVTKSTNPQILKKSLDRS